MNLELLPITGFNDIEVFVFSRLGQHTEGRNQIHSRIHNCFQTD